MGTVATETSGWTTPGRRCGRFWKDFRQPNNQGKVLGLEMRPRANFPPTDQLLLGLIPAKRFATQAAEWWTALVLRLDW
jgi:hypothetical protein